ncbi:unnamed protein product [Aspergillus oryzae]|uniref:Unnamed protein product n=1 Tax=Aspergillus oryzae var. brunneus TaxID=332754 RepID=A0ABQ6L7V5_ASPOZ|nr:unnamed protein product [Aspergillus oryzae]GMF95230.1 unnamed protein product [Aspergillus oryzae]GMG13028.1 unnamed protein product [Aspergillus oryzae]GMG50692.1 unnamed protein product [Aspergillus oryzae var. brunneus]
MASRPHSPVPASQVPCIPTHSSSTPTALRCCCGRNDCAFLQHNNVALEGLEKDLATAARLGQALLHRHESYMAEAEEDRHRFLASIENLEREKREVQVENARIIEENRGLLEQLEALNKAVADADSHAKSLEVRLENSEAELRKVTVSAARAADLDAQLVQMENEQTRLQESLESAEEESRSAVQRWKKAESTLRDLNDQIDRIEKEAREERERHAEAVQRMERKRTVERELDGAARRLKGAAATHELGRNHGGTVVSRFVRDILQDNANLQLGIVELRELLESSNQEVQCLRDQIISHQLVPMTEGDGQVPQLAPTLSQELESKEPRRAPQEFHIHHHYHTPSIKKERPALFRRSKNRHTWGHPNTVHSPSGTKIARKPTHRSQSSHSSASTMMSQPPVQIPSASQRWSSQSPGAESMASSPQSGYRSSSIFDRVERGFDSSRATSPDSTAFSPLRVSRRRSSFYDASFRSPETDVSVDPLDDGVFNKGLGDAYQPVIPEEREDSVHYATSERAFSPAPDDVFASPYRPRLTANREPSKIDQSSQTLLASMAASRQSETESATSGHSDPTGTPTRKISLTRRVGGWMREHLGNAPTAAIGDANPHQEQPIPSASQASSDTTPPSTASRKPNPKADTVPGLRYRYPGVNQKGPIMGFRPNSRAPFAIHAEAIDESLLRETLAE